MAPSERRVRYSEGDWFAVPLRDGGFAAGVIARMNPKGVLLGYFFGPKRGAVPTVDEVAGLTSADAVVVLQFGHLGIRSGRWPLMGAIGAWDRRDWPIPAFARMEELTGQALRVRYRDDDPNDVISEERISIDEARSLPIDALSGDGAVEIKLTALLPG
jgi:hypothetical protein